MVATMVESLFLAWSNAKRNGLIINSCREDLKMWETNPRFVCVEKWARRLHDLAPMGMILGDALQQAFMPKHEYETLREEDRAWLRLQKPLSINGSSSDLFPRAFYLTDQETMDYYWMVAFVPSALVFFVSVCFRILWIIVASTAPIRHWCMTVVENNYCASKRGGVRCLSILNVAFAIIFCLLALFLGSTLLTLGSSCSVPLFRCYKIASWALVSLHGATAFFLRRKAALVLDESNFAGHNIGLEMLEANPLEVTPDVQRRVSEGFKSWMGSAYLSSDEEDEQTDDYQEAHLIKTNSNRQRV
ncbi:hypothetical protein RHMOL_Rhmol07G0186600 [Rhododendron molle]|uniref:Uncharacterized protein n=1 Tax=Rhododendron molle TaxID=49168 RepID=A0ACC0N467_RHOML|nr:hypothetical protein RHMOL_Rhmol07G0186600 [Rhododendron molle]